MDTAPIDGKTAVDLAVRHKKHDRKAVFVAAVWIKDADDWYSDIEDNYLDDTGQYATGWKARGSTDNAV